MQGEHVASRAKGWQGRGGTELGGSDRLAIRTPGQGSRVPGIARWGVLSRHLHSVEEGADSIVIAQEEAQLVQSVVHWQVEDSASEEGGIPLEHLAFDVGGDVVAEANRTGRSGSAIRKLSDLIRVQGDIVDRDVRQPAREVAG